jgi:hypothetical protein
MLNQSRSASEIIGDFKFSGNQFSFQEHESIQDMSFDFTYLCEISFAFYVYSNQTQLYRSTNMQSNYSEFSEIMASDRKVSGGRRSDRRRNEGRAAERGAAERPAAE